MIEVLANQENGEIGFTGSSLVSELIEGFNNFF